ncbi:MAG: 2-amino-4-hydroxy-6-hydroxymethyldihydropteridine diphosphokinase [Paludibacteraceae bacterium]|nr:2-amino-4-hydroxy-6-hydroxymethyldihydropteridine diphosphokinase [Paludibacteraceae bacterium]
MIIYLGIGTNLGNREENLRKAVELLHERVGECIACSSVYRSAPQGFVSENEFANIVAVCQTIHSPEEVLLLTQQIEREMGRTEKSVNGVYHDRVIDIDLLQARGDEAIRRSDERLMLPHPRMQERDFVMIPLREVEAILINVH